MDTVWYRSVALYGNPEVFDLEDPDNDLLPMIVEKVLIPKLTGMIDLMNN